MQILILKSIPAPSVIRKYPVNEDEINEISKLKSILKEEFGDCEYHIFIDKDYKNGNN